MTSIGAQTIDEFLSSLAAKQPTPGGGCVAGLLSALSTSLGSMVLSYSQGKDAFKEHVKLHEDCAQFLDVARIEAIDLSVADATAYEALNILWKLPKDAPERIADWDRTVQEAITVPLQTMELCQNILSSLESLTGKTNVKLASDLAIAAILADAAARSANWNVQINLLLLNDDEMSIAVAKKADEVLACCKDVADSIERSCRL